jgi:hypothetical protein
MFAVVRCLLLCLMKVVFQVDGFLCGQLPHC